MNERKNYEVKFHHVVICDETEETIHDTFQYLVKEGAIPYTIKERELETDETELETDAT